MRIIQIVKRQVVQVVTDVVNFVIRENSDHPVGVVLSAVVGQAHGDHHAAFAPAGLLTIDGADHHAEPVGATGRAVAEQPADHHADAIVDGHLASAGAAGGHEIVRAVYQLTHRGGGVTAVNDGPQNFTSPANAAGRANGTLATRAGGVTASEANLRLTYAAQPNRAPLTITSVTLRFHTRQTGTALDNGGLRHEYRFGNSGGWSAAGIFSDNQNFLTNPHVVDITADVAGLWSRVADLQVRVRAVLPAASAAVEVACDAVEVHVTANRTEDL